MKRRIIAAAAIVALGVSAGAAWGYFSASGSGTGVALTATLTAPSIEASVVVPATALLPGGTGDATFKLDNTNTAAVTIVSVSPDGTVTPSGAPGCTSSNDGVTFTTQSALAIAVPAHATGFVVDLAGSVSMSSSSASACQGAMFSIPITVSVRQG